ncbi:hypothetical protein COZ22_04320 [bacterium (Candidatus Howlettbacteria) CG_4_10_14_3_um_filter_37_10]|nr:MAG: hypothetical protein COZ22_04320 [bacterium (Candidatus Howlettbacteria) CG_4_10_14_3_um_filter_37_10]
MEKIIKELIPQNANPKNFGNLITYEVSSSDILSVCKDLYFKHKLHLKTITAIDEGHNNYKILYVFGVPKENIFLIPYIKLSNTTEFPSLANDIHETSGYERKIQTFFGLLPQGHVNPRPIILHKNWPEDQFPLRKDFKWNDRPKEASNTYEFTKVEGEGIYEIPVGPVHAGIIEPGHFRFSVAGEEIVLLEPKLGYTHKGTEKLFETLPLEKKIKLSERVSGDSSFSHSLAFCQALESLADVNIPQKAKWLRVIFAELERLANHFGDIGFIMLDTGYSFGGLSGQRLREMIMQWNEMLTGSRFLRGVNTIGGVTKDILPDFNTKLLKDLEKIEIDFTEIMKIANSSSSLLNRLEDTGTLDPRIARDHGVIGVARRAIGVKTDARIDYSYAAYDKIQLEIATEETGDVNARFKVRIKEVYSSIKILVEALEKLVDDEELFSSQNTSLKKDAYAIGIVEGWRGDIVYFIATDRNGNITRVDVRDPSFLNWTVLGYTGKGNVVPDFPLINKSFNLSYSGNDL